MLTETLTSENCYRLGHVDVQITGSNLAKCALCGRIIYREIKQLGEKANHGQN